MRIEHFATTFAVRNFEAAMTWYVQVLGFTESFRFGQIWWADTRQLPIAFDRQLE